ncbi:MAG: hypothetical protein ACRD1P_03400 [Thermoanaerobaculia bacterium]
MKWRPVSRAIAAFSASLALAAVARPESFASAHWKSKIEMEGGGGGGEGRGGRMPMPTEFEIWTKAGKMRMKADAGEMKMNMLQLGEESYNWVDGTGQGMKSNLSASKRGGRPSHDYINKIDTVRAKGKKVGTETVDGHPCEVWEYDGGEGDRGKYWLAQDLKNFPVKIVSETPRGKTTYRNTDIRIPASVSDDMFVVPKDVVFHDMSEMMQGRPPSQ